MQTLNEVKDNIGKNGSIELAGLEVIVTIQDITIAFGNIRYQVTPVKGSKSIWVNADRVKIDLTEN